MGKITSMIAAIFTDWMDTSFEVYIPKSSDSDALIIRYRKSCSVLMFELVT